MSSKSSLFSTPALIQQFRDFVNDSSVSDSDISKYLIWGKGNFEMSLNYYYNSKAKTESLLEESRPKEKVSAWEKLRDGANKEKKTQMFIEELRREYDLPVVGKGRGEVKGYFEGTGKFAEADCLASVMRYKKSGEDERENEEDEEGDEEQEIELDEQTKVEAAKLQSIKQKELRQSIEKEIEQVRQTTQTKQVKQQTKPNQNIRQTKLTEQIRETKQTEKQTKYSLRSNTKQKQPERKTVPKLTTKSSQPQKPPATKQLPLFQSSLSHRQPPPSTSTKPSYQPASRLSESKKMISTFFQNSPSIYLGQCFIDCFSITKMEMSQYKDQYVQLKAFADKKADTKKGKNKGVEEKVVIRVYWGDQCIGRFEDNQSRVFCHLLVNGYISMRGKVFDNPILFIQFTKYKLLTEIYLEKKAITIPIVETFENQKTENPTLAEFKPIREELNSLLMKLKLSVLTPPLIQLKSKFDINNREIYRNDFAIINQQKAEKELVEKMTNPFYKETQVKLTNAFKKKEEAPKKVEEKISQIVEEDVNVEIKEDEYDQLINLNECSLEPTDPNPIFTSELHYYQALALTWTLFREGFYKSQSRSELHPMWTQFQLPKSDSKPLFFNQFTGQLSIEPPVHKNICKGGILADEMGLGKTVMMIALIATNKDTKSKYKTLVVVPLTLLDQWQTQIHTHTKHNSLNVYKYYEKKSRTQPLQNYDVIITTYGVISNQFSQGFHISKQGLYRHQWFRVILDEAHYIKGRIIQTSRAVFALSSEINWCLTGTPIQNKLDDIYSLIHFIRYTPWSDYTWWTTYINKPHNNNDQAVFTVLRTILKNVLLRRTKQTRLANGERIVNLPPKVSKIKYLTFKEKEREFYDAIYEASKKEFDELERQGAIEAKYMKIFEILIRLRQICCHPVLFKSISKMNNIQEFQEKLTKFVQKKLVERNSMSNQAGHFELLMEGEQQIVVPSLRLDVNQSHLQEVLTSIKSNNLGQCLICLSDLDNPVITMCLHIFCRTCIIQSINNIRGFCPLCRTIISKQDFMHLPHDNRLRLNFKQQFQRSTKMQALSDLINKFEEDDKVVIFSQFLGMIDLIEEDFRRQKITCVRMDGSLSQKERGKVIERFKKDKECRVFLISLKTGGVGLNLVVANKVILVDPWWNPAVEEQAIERVHRIGQKREVEVWRLIISNSIESRMIELHESKKMVSNMAISEKDNKENFAEKFRYLMAKY